MFPKDESPCSAEQAPPEVFVLANQVLLILNLPRPISQEDWDICVQIATILLNMSPQLSGNSFGFHFFNGFFFSLSPRKDICYP